MLAEVRGLLLGIAIFGACDGEPCPEQEPRRIEGHCQLIAVCLRIGGATNELRYCASGRGDVELADLARDDELEAYEQLAECIGQELLDEVEEGDP